MNWFITGTDTGVGKTYVTALLLRSLRKAGVDAVGFKPICCGTREDAEILRAAGDPSVMLDDINPLWLRPPAAPYVAAMIENRPVALHAIQHAFRALRSRFTSVLVEGAGGWLVPIRRDYFIADLAADFGLPVVVVVRNRLGALNHTLLTIRHIQAYGLACAGVILNNSDTPTPADPDIARTTNRAILEDLLGDIPILFEIQPGQSHVDLALV
jgi:dethiobiotin synthetase